MGLLVSSLDTVKSKVRFTNRGIFVSVLESYPLY